MACKVNSERLRYQESDALLGEQGFAWNPEFPPEYLIDIDDDDSDDDALLELELQQADKNYRHGRSFFSYRLFQYEKTLRNPLQAFDFLHQEVENEDSYRFELGYRDALRYILAIFLSKRQNILQKSIATLLLIARLLKAQLDLSFICAQAFIKWFGAFPKGTPSTGALLRQTPLSPLAPPV